MQQENALIGVQMAAFYPDISLSTLGGFVGSPLSQLFTVANRVWSLGASASETMFEGGARTAAVAAARATYDQSVANYRQTVLTAFQQVEDELVVAAHPGAAGARPRTIAVAAAQRAVDVTLNQYRAGTVAYTSVDHRADDAAGRSAGGTGGAAEPAGGERHTGRGTGRRMASE